MTFKCRLQLFAYVAKNWIFTVLDDWEPTKTNHIMFIFTPENYSWKVVYTWCDTESTGVGMRYDCSEDANILSLYHHHRLYRVHLSSLENNEMILFLFSWLVSVSADQALEAERVQSALIIRTETLWKAANVSPPLVWEFSFSSVSFT